MWNLLIPAITTLAGASIAAKANKKAVEQSNAAQLQAAQIQADAITKGNEQAQATLNQIRAESAPATGHLRGVIAESGELTPLQLQSLDEARRGVANQIRGSSMAGSGRTMTAAFRNVESDFVNRALESNKNRADSAARTMYGSGTSAASSVAGLQANQGTQTGAVHGNAIRTTGDNEAAGTLATGKLTGQAFGDIGAMIATEGRESRYADRMRKIENQLGLS